MKTIPVNNNPFAPRQYGELKQVTPNVYIVRNITNSSFVIGARSVALIDTQVNWSTAERVLAMIRSVTDKPIEYVINTHYHWDHTNGNALFQAQGARVISSALTKDFMVRRAPRQKEFLSGRGFELGKDPSLPDVTFEKEFHLDLGGMPLRLFFAGKAESDDATAVHVPGEGVLMSGDTVMTGSFPIFGQPVWDEGLQDRDWINTINNLVSLKPKHILPGHGPVAYDTEIALLIRIQEYFLEEVQKRVNRGLSAQETLKDLEPRLPQWITQIPLVWGTPRYAILRVYRGLTRKTGSSEQGWQQFKPSAIPSVDADRLQGIAPERSFKEFRKMADEAAEGGDAALRLSVLKKATEFFHNDPAALCAYADALIEESRKESSVLEKGDFFMAARRCWDAVLKTDPNHAGALLGKGRYLTMMAYRGGEDPREGMTLLRRALESRGPEDILAEAEFYLGIGFRRLGDEKTAKEQFQKSLSLNPAFMPAHLAGMA